MLKMHCGNIVRTYGAVVIANEPLHACVTELHAMHRISCNLLTPADNSILLNITKTYALAFVMYAEFNCVI